MIDFKECGRKPLWPILGHYYTVLVIYVYLRLLNTLSVTQARQTVGRYVNKELGRM
jgi:hypothetical protein